MDKKPEALPTKPETKKPRYHVAPDIQALAKADRILQEAEEKKPGSAVGILKFLCDMRGIIWQGEED